eukprot:2287200-Ditylum_brightwellii.AAC.1
MAAKQVEVGKSLMKPPAAHAPTYARPRNPYVSSNNTMQTVRNPYAVTSTPMKNEQYSPDEYFPTLKTPTKSLGTGTKPAYVQALYHLPAIQTAIVLYEFACLSHMSPQKVSQLPNATPTNEYVPMHRWNTSPSTPDTYNISNLTDGIDFSKPFLPDSTSVNRNKDSFLYHDNFFP